MPLLRRRSKAEDAAGTTDGKDKEKKGSGRVTPKGTTSGRYTPPTPKEYKISPTWVPVLMLTLLIAGMLVIVMNYLPGAGLLPGDTNNKYLLLGLGLITGGFITATKYR